MKKILSLALLTFFITSCENFMSSNYMNDDALIAAIQNDPYKVEIELSSMPNKSQDTINNDYFDHFAYMAQLSTDHGYQVTLGDESLDYGDVKELFRPTYKQLDHHYLNEIEGLGRGDLESILRWMAQRMSEVLPQLDRIDLYETPGCGAMLSWGEHGPALPV